MDSLSPTVFSAKVAIIKTKGATIAFSPLLLSSISLLSFSFVSGLVSVILELIAPKSLPFDAFSLKWRQNFVRLVFKKIGLHITSEGRGGRNGSYQTRNIYQYPDVTDSTSVRWELEPFLSSPLCRVLKRRISQKLLSYWIYNIIQRTKVTTNNITLPAKVIIVHYKVKLNLPYFRLMIVVRV